jgi:hypothetical protein
MRSNSLRISGDLFDQALRQGAVLSRSAAQQLEHWARLGAAVEASGLSVPELVALLQGRVTPPNPVAADAVAHQTGSLTASEPEAQLWSVKRAQQQRDLASITSGRSDNEAMSWFSGGIARSAKAVDSPF